MYLSFRTENKCWDNVCFYLQVGCPFTSVTSSACSVICSLPVVTAPGRALQTAPSRPPVPMKRKSVSPSGRWEQNTPHLSLIRLFTIPLLLQVVRSDTSIHTYWYIVYTKCFIASFLCCLQIDTWIYQTSAGCYCMSFMLTSLWSFWLAFLYLYFLISLITLTQ